MTPGEPLDEFAVVIPVNNEDQHLPACLAAVDTALRQLRHPLPRLRVVVVLDACTDGSAAIATRWPGVETLEVEFRNVGAAREHGVRHVIDGSLAPASRLWLANTDADSTVPGEWISHHVEAARAGAVVMLGAIRPDPRDLSPSKYRDWQRRHAAAPATARVHGANLGVRADAYLEAGGFPAYPEHEDVALVESLRRLGAVIQSNAECWVQTSARIAGRTPGGYAAHVRAFY
ncbi:MAG: glycosyltransferase [Microbacteriaceae bacterium]|nr:glycosyltransferase [Microbacteriaceae bacterium]